MTFENTVNRRAFALALGGLAAVAANRSAVSQDTGSSSETGDQLPAADLPSMNEQGHTFEVSSTFTGSFDSVPTEAPVYTMELPSYTADQVKDIADGFGIEGEVTDLTGGSFSIEDRNASLYVTQGRLQYITKSQMEEGDLQSDEQAITTAREWLRSHGLLPGDVGDGSILSRNDDPKTLIVSFQPVQPTPLISSTPQVTVTEGPNGQILEGTNAWATLKQYETYQLRGADLAWEEVESRRAFLDASLPTDTFQPGTTVGGAVEFTRLTLAYTSSGIPGEKQYLQPVYVFHGELSPDGTDQKFQVRAYVAALINSNQPVG